MGRRNKGLFLSIALFIILVNFLLLIVSPASSQSTPPTDGDWVINDNALVQHKMIILNGNLIIENGGDLRMRNVDFRVDCDSDREFMIKVEDGGSLEIYDSSISEYSGYQYVIIVETTGQFNIYNSNVTGYCTIESPIEDSGGFSAMAILAITIVMVIIVILLVAAMKPKPRYEDEDDFIVGMTGVVVKIVQDDDFKGKIKIDNKIWNAKANISRFIRVGTRVKVIDKENNVLIVEKTNK